MWISVGTDGNHWVKASFDSGTNILTFSTVWNFTKLNTVLMPAGSDVPDWGKKTSQSLDIDMPSGETTAKYYYTVTGMPSNWGDANAKQYVWVFKGSETGSWVPAELQGNAIKFSTSKTFDTVITVRMNPAHPSIPDWPASWGQSQNLEVKNNTAVFVLKP